MPNSFGQLFRISTWGESHGPSVGVVVDGCPPGLPLTVAEVQADLDRRRPGQSDITTPRKEADAVEFLSGVFEGRTTGHPIAMLVRNADARPEAYAEMRETFRPSHADFTYTTKYGFRDHRGGGRSSARETIGRVAAGAIARKILRLVGEIEVRAKGDSVGGVIECRVRGVPAGLGEPVFDRLEADLAKAMLSLPATKGFEIGSGFAGAKLKGTQHNDLFVKIGARVGTSSNNSGGVQGGISNGEEIIFRT